LVCLVPIFRWRQSLMKRTAVMMISRTRCTVSYRQLLAGLFELTQEYSTAWKSGVAYTEAPRNLQLTPRATQARLMKSVTIFQSTRRCNLQKALTQES
jgi:hypothetical protein